MKKFNFLICYDISDSKRLSKVAKILEKESIRIQKSIFYYMNGTKEEIQNIVKKLESLINSEEDDVRIYKINISGSINLKSAVNLKQPNLIGLTS
ncbi:MAG: CRISPR-associated endonuclease Cas2 [Campylobacterota bacterium]|nr:CRISPR-associated endonuclease Cas2 [Campylobacterota bacterium]